jgi:ribosomal protein L11 methyltransferase
MKVVVIKTSQPDDVEVIFSLAAFIELAGIEEQPGNVRLWPAQEADAGELCARLARWAPVVETVEDQNWNEAWQLDWQPIRVGDRFYLVPPGHPAGTPAGRLRLEMHPGTAFGNGDHPTTHLCLLAMERDLRPGEVFLDIGCGSGLLGEAARALGAAHAFGCDLDPSALRPGAFLGSVDAVRAAACDYVVANIQLGVLLQLLPDIARVLRPGGRGVLSGVLPEQMNDLQRAASALGLSGHAVTVLNEWASVKILKKP